MAEIQQHVVMVPFMAQGHLIPFLGLANLISHRHPSLIITIATTPLNIRTLQPLLPASAAIRLHSLPFNSSDHGLPPDIENTDSLSFPTILRFFPATESLRPHFQLLLAGLPRPPVAIIADVFMSWSVELARRLGVFHATFTTCGGYGTAALFSLYLHRPHGGGAEEFGMPGFPKTYRLHRSQLSSYLRDTDGTEPWFLFFLRQMSLSLGSDAMLCNTIQEVELEGLRVLRNVTAGLRVWPVGPLLPLDPGSSQARTGKMSVVDLATCMEWLDSHPPASVLYVSFGSQSTISTTQMIALAVGLEASGTPFIWVIRPPFGFDVKGEFKDKWLPEGFEARMREERRGLLVKGWASQLEILSHASTGGFLSHCGWNSTLESLSRGVPIIGWPLASDQFYNSRMLEELGVGVEVARGVVEEVESKEAERVIRLVMVDGEGKEMREKAGELKGSIREAMREEGEEKGSSLRAVDDFIETVVSGSRRPTSET